VGGKGGEGNKKKKKRRKKGKKEENSPIYLKISITLKEKDKRAWKVHM